MAITDYASLQAAIKNWAHRDDMDWSARAPEFIQLAEGYLSKKLRVLEMRKTATLTPTSGLYVLPAGVMEIVSLSTQANPTVALEPITAEYVDWAVGSRPGGRPRYYTMTDGGISIYPSNTGSLTLTYYAAIPPLSNENPTNWLLQKSPEAYLYASLVQAVPFADAGPERMAMWGPLAEDAINDLTRVNSMMVHSGQRMRLRGPTP